MNPWRSLRFIHRFAGRDLIRGGAWRATLVNVLSTALVTGVTLTALGLALGSQERRAVEMRERGLPPLFAGNPNLQGMLTPAVVARIGESLAKPENRCKTARSHPFFVQQWNWIGADGVVEIKGRTVAEGDPIRNRIDLDRGGWPSGTGAVGLVVTEEFLEKIGRPNAAPPLEAKIELVAGNKVVPVVGVAKHLPLGHDFLMSEPSYRDILKWDWEGEASPWSDSGPAGAAWPSPDEATNALLDALEAAGVGPPSLNPAPADAPKTWHIQAKDDGQTYQRRSWVGHFRAIREAMKLEGAPGFDDAEQIRLKPRTDPYTPPSDYHMTAIYADTLDDLENAKAVATSRPFFLQVQGDKIAELREFELATTRALWGSIIAGAVLLLNSCANLMVIQQLRAALKQAEIGMLKAMGMGAGLLRSVFLYEGMLIWMAGTLIGLPAGYGLGAAVSALWIAETPSEVFRGFYCPWYLWLLPLALAPFFLFSTWFGTRRARRLPPIRSLRPS